MGGKDKKDQENAAKGPVTQAIETTRAEAEKVADRLLVLAGGSIVADGSPDALRLQLSRMSEVRLRDLVTGEVSVHSEPDPTAYLAEVLARRPGEVQVVEVRAASLEDVYLDIVRRAEAGEDLSSLTTLQEVTR